MSVASRSHLLATAVGLGAGAVLDQVIPDPRRGHPVAGYGRFAGALERRLYAPSRGRGVLFTALAAGGPVLAGAAADRLTRRRPVLRAATVAAVTWAVLGGASLRREAGVMATLLVADDLPGARARLSHLCGRDPAGLEPPALARAVIESVAENTADAVVAPLFWGAVAGVPGLVGYRAVNTLDAMIGHRSEHYAQFGWAAARLDDLLNLAPSRLTALLTVASAPFAGNPDPNLTRRVAQTRVAQARVAQTRGAQTTVTAPAASLGLGRCLGLGWRLGIRPLLGLGPRLAPVTAPGEAAGQGLGGGVVWTTDGAPAREAWRVWRRDGSSHPSPNAGQCEAATAGALGIRLGGRNVYGGTVDERPILGDGPEAQPADIAPAVRLSALVGVGATTVGVVALALRAARRPTRGAAQLAGDAAIRGASRNAGGASEAGRRRPGDRRSAAQSRRAFGGGGRGRGAQ